MLVPPSAPGVTAAQQLPKGRPARDADRGTTLLDRYVSTDPLASSPLLVLVTEVAFGVLPTARR
jgi:hypothetical protein